MADMLPMPLNQTITKAALSAYLGKTFQVGGRSYRLVYNAATMVAPKQKAITYTIITGGTAPVWSACKVQSAAAGQTRVAGVSVMTATGNITAGSYFYVQRSGDALLKFGATCTAYGMVGTGTVTTYVGCAAPIAAMITTGSTAGFANSRKRFAVALVTISAADLTSGTAQLVRLDGII